VAIVQGQRFTLFSGVWLPAMIALCVRLYEDDRTAVRQRDERLGERAAMAPHVAGQTPGGLHGHAAMVVQVPGADVGVREVVDSTAVPGRQMGGWQHVAVDWLGHGLVFYRSWQGHRADVRASGVAGPSLSQVSRVALDSCRTRGTAWPL